MKVFLKQDGDLPSVAGLAKLKYANVKEPARKEGVITLPENGWNIYQLNNNFSQFLVLKAMPEEHDFRDTPPRKAWFGGTDERPFLVELQDVCTLRSDDKEDIDEGDWVKVWQSGRFYETIKPEIISEYEKRFGKDQTVRQGDMFCYPMPIQDWGKLLCVLESVKSLHFMRYGKGYNKETDSKLDPYPTIIDEPESLYETRHRFYGELAIWGEYVIGKGIIKAPDHNDLLLSDICIIAQTENLNNPKKAD